MDNEDKRYWLGWIGFVSYMLWRLWSVLDPDPIMWLLIINLILFGRSWGIKKRDKELLRLMDLMDKELLRLMDSMGLPE